MKIELIEDKVEKLGNSTYQAILELIVTAVRDYPVKELSDVEDYIQEVKILLNTNDIDIAHIDKYISQHNCNEHENDIWIESSLNSLAEAIDLMNCNDLKLSDILKAIEQI